jgi:hypothetical protein
LNFPPRKLIDLDETNHKLTVIKRKQLPQRADKSLSRDKRDEPENGIKMNRSNNFLPYIPTKTVKHHVETKYDDHKQDEETLDGATIMSVIVFFGSLHYLLIWE